ncbi:MAG: SDR family NAD(P)-dependent oxidoreductase [Candidatus Kariarchaeaceae archaeon]|jgi:NAD(P)-dependent dehydrogenase (short-subunit alcohol dehydrogenase family)
MESNFGPVLVTGADTGIGRLTVETLADKGYKVYAGVYDPNNVEILSNIENVKAVKTDVTNEEDMKILHEWVEKEGAGLYGIVNNAGISDIWPLIESPESYFHRVMDVNLYGVFRVSNAVMPFLIKSKGRIVTIGSLSGTIPTKLIGAYSISKFAVEALTDIYHFETKAFGIQAITIKPGNMQSDISKALAPILKLRKPEFEKSAYKGELSALFDNLDNPDYLERSQYEKPVRVVDAIINALYSPNPKSKYLVASQSDTNFALKWMFRVAAQLNQDHEQSVDREKLHSMLDRELDKFQ